VYDPSYCIDANNSKEQLIQEITELRKHCDNLSQEIISLKSQSQAENQDKLKAKLANVIEMARLGPWEYDILNDQFIFSDQFYKMFRTTAEKVGGYTMSSAEYAQRFLHPDDIHTVKDETQKAIEASDPQFSRQVDHRIIYADGEVGYITVKYFIQKDENGQTVKTFGVNQDITERKRAENALKESETLLNTIVDAIPAPIFYKDTHGVYFGCNIAFCELLALSKNEIIGRTVFDLSFGDLADRYHMADLELLKTGELQVYECDVINAKGLRRRAIFHKAPFYGAYGDIKGIVGVMMDITDRKRTEQELKDKEQHFRDLANMLPEAVFEADRDINLTFVSQQALTIFGYTIQDFESGINGFDMLAAEDQQKAHKYIENLLQDKKDGLSEFKGKKKNGEVFPILLNLNPIHNNGIVEGFRGIVIDITERKKMEERLQQAQKMESIGNLAGGIAHDFNNLLFPIIGNCELLLENISPNMPEYENLQDIYMAGKRGSDLVNQILAFSRQSEHKKIPVRIQKVLGEVLKLVRSTIPSSIEINSDIQADCGVVMADPTKINQIAMNLITNAYHAVEQNGGKISIQLKETTLTADRITGSGLGPGKYATLIISDTGCGIDPSIRDRIFDPYFTTKEQRKGTGLGLAVVLGIVKDYRGDIKINSEVGEGSVFAVYLPLMEKLSDNLPDINNLSFPTGSEHILLVDDEASIARLQKQILERLGYRVTARVSSMDALEAFKVNPVNYDLVITDMTMPNMTGDQLAREIISIKPGVPVIICTGFSEKIDPNRAAAMGIKGFLMKPVVRSELAEMVKRVLSK
jgi:PAS domain S-box-containing protein